jgi:hypothetical protein
VLRTYHAERQTVQSLRTADEIPLLRQKPRPRRRWEDNIRMDLEEIR